MSDNASRRTGKNASMLLFGTLFRMFVSFGFIVLAADWLGLEGFGIYSIGVHYFELFLSLAGTAVGILLTREIARNPESENENVTSAMVLGFVIAVAGIACLIAMTLLRFSGVTSNVLLIASVALVPATWGVICEAIFVAHERSEFVALALSVESTLRVLACIAALLMGYGLYSLFVILIISRTVQLGVYLVFMRRVTQLRFKFSYSGFVSFIRRWKTFAAENWMATLYTNLDVLMLSWLINEAAVGIYSAAWKIVRIGSVAAKAYTTAVFPLLARLYQNSKTKFAQLNFDTVRLMCVVAFPIVVSVCVLSNRVIDTIYFNGEYADAAPVLMVLIWVMLLEFLNPFLSHTLFASEHQSKSMQVAAIALIANITITAILVPRYSAMGAAIGTLVSGCIATACYMVFALSRAELINSGKIILRTLLAASGVGFMLYFMNDYSWLLIIPVAIVGYLILIVLFRVVGYQDVEFIKSIISKKNILSDAV